MELKPGNQTEEGRKEVIKGPDRQGRGQHKQMIRDNKRKSQQKQDRTVEGRKPVSPLDLQHRSGCCLVSDIVPVSEMSSNRTHTVSPAVCKADLT